MYTSAKKVDIYPFSFPGRIKIFPKAERIIAFTSEPVTLTCEYKGSEKVQLLWRKDISRDVSDFRFTSNRRTITGSEVTSILKITKRSIEQTDAGEYTCSAGPLLKSVILEVHGGRFLVAFMHTDRMMRVARINLLVKCL